MEPANYDTVTHNLQDARDNARHQHITVHPSPQKLSSSQSTPPWRQCSWQRLLSFFCHPCLSCPCPCPCHPCPCPCPCPCHLCPCPQACRLQECRRFACHHILSH